MSETTAPGARERFGLSRKGYKIQGERNMRFWRQRLRHHGADVNGRMYLCGCTQSFRVGSKIHDAIGPKRYAKSFKGSRYRRPEVRRKPWRTSSAPV